MANNTIYIAAAGAGKTTLIIRQATELYKTLIPQHFDLTLFISS